MITIIRQVTKIFTLLDYYQEYRKDFKEDVTMRLPLYSAIIQLFFKKCKNHVLEGNIIVLPIGKFKVCQIVRDMSKKVVSQSATRVARLKAKEEGLSIEEVSKIKVYRTNTSYHALQWKQSKMFDKYNLDFVFKEIREVGRSIPKYFN